MVGSCLVMGASDCESLGLFTLLNLVKIAQSCLLHPLLIVSILKLLVSNLTKVSPETTIVPQLT